MGYLFSVKDRQVCFNGEAYGDLKTPTYFGEPNFLDGDLSLPPTKENITAVSLAFTKLFINTGGMFLDPDYYNDKHNRDGRLFVNYSKSKLGGFDAEDAYLKHGLEEFNEGDWDLKVDRLHLPNEKTRSDLLEFLNDL